MLATGVDVPNATFPITNHDQWQAGMAIVTGYRGRFPLGSATDAEAQHNGLFVAANVRYLLGLWFNRDDLQVELRTNAASVVVPSSNVTILEQTARGGVAGSGVALDFGVEAVHDRWEIGVGANGVGNRITWRNVMQETHTQASLTSGDSDFETGETTTIGDVRVTLPTDVRAHVKYFAEGWSLAVGGGHGFGGDSFHSGVEKRTGRFELRGGFRYMFSHWNPSGGLGVDLSRRVSFDVAVFGSNTNVELKRQASVAFSVRLNHKS